jgi:hypothetical protein
VGLREIRNPIRVEKIPSADSSSIRPRGRGDRHGLALLGFLVTKIVQHKSRQGNAFPFDHLLLSEASLRPPNPYISPKLVIHEYFCGCKDFANEIPANT